MRCSRQPFPVVLLLALAVVFGCERERRDHSVLLISADSLRADRLRLWNPEGGVATPRLEALAARGAVAESAWAVAPWTAPSMVSVFTGRYPPAHGVVHRDDTTFPGISSLPRLLGDDGWVLGNFSFFSSLSYFENLGLGERRPGLSHRRLASNFDRWLGEDVPVDRPFFAWLHLLEPHLPYGASGYRAREVQISGSSGLERAQLEATLPVGSAEFVDGDRSRLLELYDRDVAEMDRTLGEILDALEKAGRRDSTLVVFVADHGEELLEDGWVGHASTAVEAKLMPETLRIPFVLAGPGVPPGTPLGGLVQQVDVLPTLLRLLGRSIPEGLDGESLVPGWLDGGRWEVERSVAFFDSSVGGNLTPEERRDERVLGATDGECLLELHRRPDRADEVRIARLGETECPDRRRRLRERLAAWSREQTTAAFRGRTVGEAEEPAPEEVVEWSERIEIQRPRDAAVLEHESTAGQIVLAWDGGSAPWWVEYEAGAGPTAVQGAFESATDRVVFGPFPEGFWNDVARHGPFRFRVLDPTTETKSPWRTFRVVPQ